MKISKLPTAVLLASVLLCPIFTALPAKADEAPAFVVESTSAKSGDENVVVSVSVKNNPGISSFALDIGYDDSALTLTGFTYNTDALGGAYTTPFNESAKPPCLFAVNGTQNMTGDFKIADLYFDIDSSSNGSYDVTLTYDEDNVYDLSEKNIRFDVVGGTVTVDGDQQSDTSPCFKVQSVTAKNGETADVTVSVVNNPGIASLALDIIYDKSALTLTDFTYNTAALNGSSTTPFNASADPPCLFMVNGSENVSGDFELATLHFAVSDTASGSYDVTLKYDEDNVYSIDEENIRFKVVGGKITVGDIPEAVGILGDIDGDKEITANDALLLLRASVGMSELSATQFVLGDIDGDNDITANDALAVLRFSVGLDGNSKIGKPIDAV